MAGGTWNTKELPVRPGVYFNFVESASSQIRGGARGVVALALRNYGVNVSPHTFHKVSDLDAAIALVDKEYSFPISLVLQGGAKEVLFYALPKESTTEDFEKMRTTLDAYPFHVFVWDAEVTEEEQGKTVLWAKSSQTDGKPFLAILGGTSAEEDLDPTLGNARSVRVKDTHVINLISGVILDKKPVSSAKFAPWVAGMVAGTAINQSVTYKSCPAEEVTRRLSAKETAIALESGSFVLTNDGEKVKIEQGITTSTDKIRAIRTRQAIIQDVTRTASDAYIGQLQNNPDGQATLMAMIMAYLEKLETSSVLQDPSIQLDLNFKSIGDAVFLQISYIETDSMERIFFTINL